MRNFNRFNGTALASMLLLAGCGSDGPPQFNDPDVRAEALLAKMTQSEKIQLVHGAGLGASPLRGAGYIPGIDRLGIPSIDIADSSTGINIEDTGATAFPSPLALAATWDPTVAHDYGSRIGAELKALGFAEGLGGAIALSRDPRNGVANENMGEDPVLVGLMGAQRTIGTQSQNVIATLKQYALYDQQTNRFGLNVIADERTIRELYLLPFEIAVKEADPGNIMCSYNMVNGLQTCQSPYLFSVLKNEWKFKGITQSDWVGGVTNTIEAANAGLDEEMPGAQNDYDNTPGFTSFFNQKLTAEISSGTVTQARLDDMVKRKLRTLYRIGLMDAPPKSGGVIDTNAGNALAQKVAERGIVLLKNSSSKSAATLPLKTAGLRSIVVIGGHADVGVMSGGGSGGAPAQAGNPVACLTPGAVQSNPPFFSLCATFYKSSPLEAMRKNAPGVTITYLDGSDILSAANAAAAADVAVVFATQFGTEGVDLPSLSLPNNVTDPANQAYDQNALISAVAAKNAKTVVVIQSNSAVTMPWIDEVSSVVAAWYPGVQGGTAIANVLFGLVNPSGKLPVTFPKRDQDMPQPAISSSATSVNFVEGLNMGYRWYDAKNIAPLFPFGHGLSYTTFSFFSATAKVESDVVKVSVSLKNTGTVQGAQVAQVYATLPASAAAPPQRLVAWQKVDLAPGESKVLVMTVPKARFAIWDTANGAWRIPSGNFSLSVGGSSRDPSATKTSIHL